MVYPFNPFAKHWIPASAGMTKKQLQTDEKITVISINGKNCHVTSILAMTERCLLFIFCHYGRSVAISFF
jgi:hypothetical protein